MKELLSVLLVGLLALAVQNCTMVAMQPVPVGVSGAAVDRLGSGGVAPPASEGAVPLPARPPGLRGEVLFPRYDYLSIPTDALAEVWIDEAYVGPLHAGVGKVWEVSGAGVHAFSVQVYRYERQFLLAPYTGGKHRYQPDYGQQEPKKIYMGCGRGQFSVEANPSSASLLYGVFWRLVIPPPSPLC